MNITVFDLPYPPSVNHYYQHSARGVTISAKGIKYRHDAYFLLASLRGKYKDKKIAVSITVFPPDKRKRDLDNILKCLLDAMEYAQVYENDYNINSLTVLRREMIPAGRVQIAIAEYDN